MVDALREHRVGVVAWVVGGAVAMLVMGLALAQEMDDFPGGPQALATSILPAAEAMRPLRWPAERLDTLGGYLTFHNIVLFQGFLAIYAAVQGARAIRGTEDRHALEQVLATGWSRAAVMRDRTLGFGAALALITVGLAGAVALTMAAAGEPDPGGSLVTMTAVGLCALVAFSLGLLVSQLVSTSRAAAGVSVMTLVVLYVGTNVWEEVGPFGLIRFVSPFHLANASRALVPGHGLDVAGMLALVLMSLALTVLAGVAFARRDYGAALWTRARADRPGVRAVRVQHWWLGSIWVAGLARHRYGLLAWTLSVAAFGALMMALQPAVMDVWELFDFMAEVMGGSQGASAEVLYLSFAADVSAPLVVGYVIAQSAGWVADLEQGRVEQVLSAPVSWTRLVLERMLSACVGAAIVVAATAGALVVGAVLVGSAVDAAGVGRLVVVSLLLAWAVSALAALAVAALRSGIALTALAVYVAGAYLLTWLIPIFHWPAWVSRLSVFEAFGHPYQGWPSWAGLLLMVAIAGAGSVAASMIAERTPKVA